MNRFPDFFIVGAPKCGTTSLFFWLQQHPDTYLPWKEPNFLSPDVVDVSSEPDAAKNAAEWLSRLCPPEAQGKVTGESTPKYLYSDLAREKLAKEADRIRVIVMLRNPVDLAVAMHAQNCREGRERETDFMKAWNRGPVSEGDKLSDYRRWGMPGAQLARYLEAFPADRIKVLILEEEMRTDPQSAHASVLKFLGLSPQVLGDYSAQNQRRGFASTRLQGQLGSLRRATYRLLDRLNIKIASGTGLLKLANRLNSREPSKAGLPPYLRQAIAAELQEDARLVARLLNRKSLPWDGFEWEDRR